MTKIKSIHIGKVRNSVVLCHGTRILQTTDRLSAFDRVFPFLVPGKGEILQNLSLLMFEKTKGIIGNHVLGVLDKNHLLVQEAQVFPIEIIVRGNLTGSLWKLYEEKGPQGVWDLYGIELPAGLAKNALLDSPIVTPTTKSLGEHDAPLTHAQAASLIGENKWAFLSKKALDLFVFGRDEAEKKGLWLVDSKYEMGEVSGKIILVDEIHTPDSSRYWLLSEKTHPNPKQISKELFREEITRRFPNVANLNSAEIDQLLANDPTIIPTLQHQISSCYLELFQVLAEGKNPAEVTKHFLDTESLPWPVSKTQVFSQIQSQTLPRKILVVGNGGRDYTLAKEWAKWSEVQTIYLAAGNRDWQHFKFVKTALKTAQEIAIFCKENAVGLVVVGPEAPITQGIEKFCAEQNIPVLAPSLPCASLEASKIICKKVIGESDILTSKFEIFSWPQLKRKLEDKTLQIPCVLKYDGLAAGKGVILVNETAEFSKAIAFYEENLPIWEEQAQKLQVNTYSKQQGESCFLVEEMLAGEEISVMALCNGVDFRLLPLARDFKRRNCDQKGANTGGMGAVSPLSLSPELLKKVKMIFQKTLNTLAQNGTPYFGFLFAGLMVTKEQEPFLLEFNCRLGDPETQVILPSLQRDFYVELFQTAQKKPFIFLENSGEFFPTDFYHRVFVVGISPEYPENMVPKRQLVGPKKFDFQTGVQLDFIPSAIEENGFTTGGRVFGILATAEEHHIAQKAAQAQMKNYHLKNFDGSCILPHWRSDIGL